MRKPTTERVTRGLISGAARTSSARLNGALERFSDTIIPLFRVKVVDRTSTHGRILAALDKIRPESVDNEPAGSHALLFVEYDDLGNTIWRLDLDGDWPVLKLNQKAEDVGLLAASDPRFFALVYPEVFRRVLGRILIEDEHTDPDCDDDWPSLWLKLARHLPGMDAPPATVADQEAWIDRATEAFRRGTTCWPNSTSRLRKLAKSDGAETIHGKGIGAVPRLPSWAFRRFCREPASGLAFKRARFFQTGRRPGAARAETFLVPT